MGGAVPSMRDQMLQRLAEAIAWCSVVARPGDPARCLRTRDFLPPMLSALPETEWMMRLLDSEMDTGAAVEFVNEQRQAMLSRLALPIPPADGNLAGGRLMRTDLMSDSCEIAIVESKGFFDADDIPPWDCWFWHGRTGRWGGWVYCWVPPSLVELADQGMRVIPVEPCVWVDSIEELLR